MSDKSRVSRRHFLGGIAGTAAAAILAACGGSSATSTPAASGATTAPAATKPAAAATTAPGAATTASSPAAAATTAPAATTAASGSATTGTTAPAVITSTGKMTYWGGLIFSPEANDLQVKAIKDWGTQNKIAIDVVMINQNDTNTKVAAAIESNTLPDAFDMGLDLLQLQHDKLVPLDDLYAKIGKAHGGWLKAVDTATDPNRFGGTRSGIPYGMGGNVLFRRTDVLKKAGFNDPPKTWTELSDMSEKVTKPPLYGMAFAISNVGDGNDMVSIMQSWGGRVADDQGKTCTIKSAETKAFLQWVTDEYKKGQFPPGVATWDGAGDNNAYQSGQAVFIKNTGSVTVWMRANDKDLLNNTQYSALPSGPKMIVSPSSPLIRGIAKSSKNVDAAKALIEYLAGPDFTQKYYPLAIYGPVLQGETSYDLFKTDPVHIGLADLVVHGTAPAFPDVSNTAYADFNNNYIVPKMIQRVVIDKVSLDQAIDEAQKAGDAIYAKYK
ncbi:MAG: ABC transporter substrate-binding protein [Thermomicrobiales bacterium]